MAPDVLVCNGPTGYLYGALTAVGASARTIQVNVRRRPRAALITASINPDRIDACLNGAEATHNQEPYLLTISRIQEHKAHDVLLSAFAEVASIRDDVRLVCVGGTSPHTSSNYRRALTEFVRVRKIADRVSFTGFLSDRDVYRLLAGAYALVHPAVHESFGLVVLEAMYLAKPVVAAASEGPSLIVAHGETGLLVPPNDSARLAEALLTLLEPDEGQVDGRRRP